MTSKQDWDTEVNKNIRIGNNNKIEQFERFELLNNLQNESLKGFFSNIIGISGDNCVNRLY